MRQSRQYDNGARKVTWEASDADGDALHFAVHYSSDGGQSWLPLVVDVISKTLDVDAGLLTGSTNCVVRVIATDGLNTTVAESGVFGVDMHKPSAMIVSAPVVELNQQVILNGDGFDPDEGSLPAAKLVWRSSRDGVLGTGQTLVTAPLSFGTHTITLTVTDADANSASATTNIQIGSSLFLPEIVK